MRQETHQPSGNNCMYADLRLSRGLEKPPAQPAAFIYKENEIRLLVHGDVWRGEPSYDCAQPHHPAVRGIAKMILKQLVVEN